MPTNEREFKFKLRDDYPIVVFTEGDKAHIKTVKITSGQVRKDESLEFCLNFNNGHLCVGAKLKGAKDARVPVEVLPTKLLDVDKRCVVEDFVGVLTEKECYELTLSEIARLFDSNGNFLKYDSEKQKELDERITRKYSELKFSENKEAKDYIPTLDYLSGRNDDVYQTYMNISLLLWGLGIRIKMERAKSGVIEDDIDVNSEVAHNIILEERDILERLVKTADDTINLHDLAIQKAITPGKKVIVDENKTIRNIKVDCDSEPVLVTDINQTVLFKLTNRFLQKYELVNACEDSFVTHIEGLDGYIIPVLKIDTEKYSFKKDDLEVFASKQDNYDVLNDLGVNVKDVKTFESEEFRKVLDELRLEIFESDYYTQKCINDFLRGFVYKTVTKEDGTVTEIADNSPLLKPNLKRGYDLVLRFLRDSDKDELLERFFDVIMHLDEYGNGFIIDAFKYCSSRNLGLVSPDVYSNETKPCDAF